MSVLMKKTVGRSAVIILFGLLQACSVLPRPEVVAVEYFTLESPTVPAASTVQSDPAGPVLLIARPQVRPDLDTPRMAYRQQDYTLQLLRAQSLVRCAHTIIVAGADRILRVQRAFRGGATHRFAGDAAVALGYRDTRIQPGFSRATESFPAALACAVGRSEHAPRLGQSYLCGRKAARCTNSVWRCASGQCRVAGPAA